MKLDHLLAGSAGLCRALLCLLGIICLTTSSNGQVDNFKPDKNTPNSLVKWVQQIYTSQIGIREKGTNSGPEVEKYLRYVNLSKGNPWCAAFVCWVLGEAGVSNPKSGWSPDLFPASKTIYESGKPAYRPVRLKAESGKLTYQPGRVKTERHWAESRCAYPPLAGGLCKMHTPLAPHTADIFALYFPEKRRIAHTGFIDQWDGTLADHS